MQTCESEEKDRDRNVEWSLWKVEVNFLQFFSWWFQIEFLFLRNVSYDEFYRFGCGEWLDFYKADENATDFDKKYQLFSFVPVK